MKIGDRVQFSQKFLRNTGQFTGDVPFAKGIVTEIEKFGQGFTLVTVDWDVLDSPAKVNMKNLEILN